MAMSYTEPPPKTVTPGRKQAVSFIDTELAESDRESFRLRKARVGDVEDILVLINDFAAMNLMLPRGPQYLYENIRDFVVVTLAADKAAHVDNEPIVACGSLHVLWEDIGEIRGMAIHGEYQNLGIGGQLIAHMKSEATTLGLKQLFTFTLAEAFFAKLGFAHRERNDLPPKVWGECSRCPKYFRCDEIGMFLDL
jgi:amino-acid N-acetyltransferase